MNANETITFVGLLHQVCQSIVFQDYGEAKCDRWLAFLEETFPGRPDRHRDIQQFFGNCLLPTVSDPMAMLLCGQGVGKSTIAEVLTALLGRDRVSTLPFVALRDPFAIASLKDVLLNVVTDSEISSTTAFKQVISGVDLMANRKYRDPIVFKPHAKWLVICHGPVPAEFDQPEIARRVLTVFVDKHQQSINEDPFLAYDLKREIPGILKWTLDGLMPPGAAIGQGLVSTGKQTSSERACHA